MTFPPAGQPEFEPLIIPRPEHNISRADIEVEALKVLYRLHQQGYKAYLVGGSVRDLLLGKAPKDFDVVTDAHPGKIRRLFRNSRIIGRRFRLVQVFFRGGKIVEVSTFRRRSEFDSEEELLASHNTFGSPAEDAQRRDLTINGLFYNIADFSVIDYVGGLKDLLQGRIRVIGPPGLRFRRDPVRMLRVVRHAARTGFTIDPPTWEEILAHRHLIRQCVPSRVRDELLKDLRGGAARQFLELLMASGLLGAIFPSWEQFLGPSPPQLKTQQRLLDLFSQVDDLIQAAYPLREAFFWAVFITPYLERFSVPPEVKDFRHWVQAKVLEALSGLEFPRGRRDEVCVLLAIEQALALALEQGRRIPRRLTRRSGYAEAELLYKLKSGSAQASMAEILATKPEPGPLPKPFPKKRRRRRTTRPRIRKKSSPRIPA